MQKKFTFAVSLEGLGETEEEAWSNALATHSAAPEYDEVELECMYQPIENGLRIEWTTGGYKGWGGTLSVTGTTNLRLFGTDRYGSAEKLLERDSFEVAYIDVIHGSMELDPALLEGLDCQQSGKECFGLSLQNILILRSRIIERLGRPITYSRIRPPKS